MGNKWHRFMFYLENKLNLKTEVARGWWSDFCRICNCFSEIIQVLIPVCKVFWISRVLRRKRIRWHFVIFVMIVIFDRELIGNHKKEDGYGKPV
jgi:mannose/fructose/N-acetylgalactosamine-specific phosphotransferase system component IID